MAKRFTDTDLFKKRFIRDLEAPYKLLWIYIYHDCDHAGIWETDMQVASLRIGFDISSKQALEKFGDRVQAIDGGDKWFIPSFIDFQYGVLNPSNRAHLSVINKLDKYSIKPLASPLQAPSKGAMDMDKDKDMVKDKDKDKDKKKTREKKLSKVALSDYPWISTEFLDAWKSWLEYRDVGKSLYKTAISEKVALGKLAKRASETDGGKCLDATAIELIHTSMERNWKGFFTEKNNTNGQSTHEQKLADGANYILNNPK